MMRQTRSVTHPDRTTYSLRETVLAGVLAVALVVVPLVAVSEPVATAAGLGLVAASAAGVRALRRRVADLRDRRSRETADCPDPPATAPGRPRRPRRPGGRPPPSP